MTGARAGLEPAASILAPHPLRPDTPQEPGSAFRCLAVLAGLRLPALLP